MENVPLSSRVSEAGRQGAHFAHNRDPRDTSTADLNLLKTGRTKGCTRRSGWRTLEKFCSLYIRAFQTWWTYVMGSFVACGGMNITLPGLCSYYCLRKYSRHKKVSLRTTGKGHSNLLAGLQVLWRRWQLLICLRNFPSFSGRQTLITTLAVHCQWILSQASSVQSAYLQSVYFTFIHILILSTYRSSESSFF